MGLFGAKNRRTREIANEVLRPLGVTTDKLKEHSKVDFEKQMRSVVDRNAEQALYDRQTGWRKGEA